MEYRGEFSSKEMHKDAPCPTQDTNQGARVSDSKSDTRSRCLGLSQDLPPLSGVFEDKYGLLLTIHDPML